jgi:hypothetical protein
MNRAALLAAALLLAMLQTAPAHATVEGNPDERPSMLFSFGKGWGTSELLDASLVPADKSDVDETRVGASLRYPIHRSLTGEVGYLYRSEDWSTQGEFAASLSIPSRGHYHLLNLSMRFYF